MLIEGHVSHAGLTSQKERIALNSAYEKMARIEACLFESEEAQASFENQLYDKGQELHMYQANLEHERTRILDLEKQLDCVWRSHTKLDEILSKVEFHLDDQVETQTRMSYNITELVFEVAAKEQLIHEMQSKLVQNEGEHDAYLVNIAELEEKLRLESAQHTEQSMLQNFRIHELAKLSRNKDSEVHVGGEGSAEVPKPVKRRRRLRAKSKAEVKMEEDDEQTRAQGDGPLPIIEEEL